MKISRIAFFPFLSLLIVACNHPIEIVGDGDVTSASGNRNCYLEDYKASKDNCTKNTVVGEYKETYSALPKEGWIFEGWDGCQIAVGDECSFDISGEAVIKAWGATAPSLTATFIKSTLPAKPVDSGIYGIDYASNSRLLIINEFTGVTKIVGRVGKRVTDIAFIGDQLFGITFSDLLAIDTSGGQGKTIGYTGYASLNALASYRGKLFAASTSGELIEIDTDTGEGKFIGYFGSGLYSAGDLVFDEAGNLYGTVAGGGSIFGSFSNTELATVDIDTGQATVIGDTGFRSVWGLTITSHGLLGATAGGQLLRINENTGAASLLFEDKSLEFSGLTSGTRVQQNEQEPKYSAEDIRNWVLYEDAGGDQLRQAYVHWFFEKSNSERAVQTIGALNRIGPNTAPVTILDYVDSVMLDVVRSRELLALLSGNPNLTSMEHGELYPLWLLNRARNKYQPPSIDYVNLELEGFKKLSPQKSAFHAIGLDAEDVEKWVHESGQEYVFVVGNNGQMEIVFDGKNNGTYNYCNLPGCHMIMDILPWVKWGATVDDESTPEDRARLFQKSFLLFSNLQDMFR